MSAARLGMRDQAARKRRPLLESPTDRPAFPLSDPRRRRRARPAEHRAAGETSRADWRGRPALDSEDANLHTRRQPHWDFERLVLQQVREGYAAADSFRRLRSTPLRACRADPRAARPPARRARRRCRPLAREPCRWPGRLSPLPRGRFAQELMLKVSSHSVSRELGSDLCTDPVFLQA